MKRIIFTLITLLFAFSLQSQVERKIVVEHFTNSRCPTCASNNPALYEVLQDYPQVIHIAFHPSSPYSNCIFSQYNPIENDARTNYYGIYGSTPRVVLQGQVIGYQSPLLKPEQIDAEEGKLSDYEVSVRQTEVSTAKVKVTTIIKRVSDRSEESLLFFSGIVEKSVEYDAPNGENNHPDVFRKGLSNEIIDPMAVNDSIVIIKDYSFDPVWDKDMMYVFAILQDNDTKEIIQVEASGTIGNPAAISEKGVESLKNVFYPNPVGNTLHIQSAYAEKFTHAELFDLTGSMIRSFDNMETINTAYLRPGIYFIQFVDKNNRKFSTKIIKNQ